MAGDHRCQHIPSFRSDRFGEDRTSSRMLNLEMLTRQLALEMGMQLAEVVPEPRPPTPFECPRCDVGATPVHLCSELSRPPGDFIQVSVLSREILAIATMLSEKGWTIRSEERL